MNTEQEDLSLSIDRLLKVAVDLRSQKLKTAELETEVAELRDQCDSMMQYKEQAEEACEIAASVREELASLRELVTALAGKAAPAVTVTPTISVPKQAAPNIVVQPASQESGKTWEITIPSVDGGPARKATIQRTG